MKVEVELDLKNYASENKVTEPIAIDTNKEGKTTDLLSIKAVIDSLKAGIKS